MDIHLHFKKLFFLAFVLLVALCSCTNNAPDLNSARLSVIFDYADMESLPAARLGVFVEAASNPHRFGTITVSTKKSDISWEVNDLLFAQNEDQKYLGAVNLVMPQDLKFPTGEYDITFVQLDEEQVEVKVPLFYDKTLYETKGSEAARVMSRSMASRMLKIFDENKKVIYYGPWTNEFTDARSIWNVYREAREYQETWVSGGGTVICNLPVEKVAPGN